MHLSDVYDLFLPTIIPPLLPSSPPPLSSNFPAVGGGTGGGEGRGGEGRPPHGSCLQPEAPPLSTHGTRLQPSLPPPPGQAGQQGLPGTQHSHLSPNPPLVNWSQLLAAPLAAAASRPWCRRSSRPGAARAVGAASRLVSWCRAPPSLHPRTGEAMWPRGRPGPGRLSTTVGRQKREIAVNTTTS